MTCPRCHGERDVAIVKDGSVSETYPCPVCCQVPAAPKADLRKALEEIARVGKWTGTDGVEYTTGEGRLAQEALAATPPSRPGTAGAWTADEFWQYVGGLAGEWEAGEMRRMMHERGLALSPQDCGPSEPLRCLRCGTVDAFGPVSAEKT